MNKNNKSCNAICNSTPCSFFMYSPPEVVPSPLPHHKEHLPPPTPRHLVLFSLSLPPPPHRNSKGYILIIVGTSSSFFLFLIFVLHFVD